MEERISRDEVVFRRIYDRQWQDRWREKYDAAIHATGREAPGASQATILVPEKLGGRQFHCLSNAEAWVALLALFNPRVWEIHEQRILYPTPRGHYLDGHPRGAGRVWKPFRGTLDVAQRLGFLGHIRAIRLAKNQGESYLSVPVFWMGDHLLFLEDELGPYLVNWPVKSTSAAFGQPGPRDNGRIATDRQREKAQARREMESAYYLDAEIRSQEIAGDQIDFDLRCNLRDLFLDHGRKLLIGDEEQHRAIELFAAAVGSDEPANTHVRAVAGKLAIAVDDARVILRQAIWRRQIRIDLFRPFLLDRPLQPEREDPLDRYASWFRR